MNSIIINPSDFAYLFDRCPRCSWLKVRGVKDVPPDIPRFYQEMDARMKVVMTPEIMRAMGIPVVDVIAQEWIVSKPVELEGTGKSAVIRGKLDKLYSLDYGVALEEFKTMPADQKRVEKFRRQVHAYMYALEHPEKGEAVQVMQIGLTTYTSNDLVSRPDLLKDHGAGCLELPAYFRGAFVRQEVEIDRNWFYNLIQKYGRMLVSEEMPESGEYCDACRHASEIVRYLRDAEKRAAKLAAEG